MRLAFLFFSLALAAPAWAIPVSVQVVGPDDKPLPGATLSIVEGDYNTSAPLKPRDIAGQNGRFEWEWDGAFATKAQPLAPNFRKYLYARVQAPGMATETRGIARANSTIHLQSGRAWGGVVLDADQKPLAGASVRLQSWSVPGPSNAPDDDAETAPDKPEFAAIAPEWARRAVTEADGRWQMDDLPARAKAQVGLDDARFVKKSLNLSIGAGEAPPIFARLGAALTGVLVAPDGATIADAPVSLGWGDAGGNVTRTDAAGRFTLSGIAPGEISLYSLAWNYGAGAKASADYVIPSLERLTAVAGQTRDIGQWRAQKGLLLTARVVEAGTQKPIAGASLDLYRGGVPSVADAEGRIQMRVLPEAVRSPDSRVGSASAPGYTRQDIARPTVVGEAADLGTIELTPGAPVKGNARVENETGAIADLPQMMLDDRNGHNGYIGFWGGKTGFETQALPPGTYRLGLGFDGQSKSKDWEIVAPLAVTVPAVGAPAKPLEIVLRRLSPAVPALGEVLGRVVDGEGKPVGGAIVSVVLKAGDSSDPASVVSAGDGSFALDTSNYVVATALDVIGVERPGYLLAGAPQTQIVDGRTTIVVTLKKAGAIFAGRVLDAQGGPVDKAWVAAVEARDYPPVQTAPDGTFAMRDLPLDHFTLMAAQGLSVATIETTASAKNAELRLQSPPAPDREALANQALQGPLGYFDVTSYWDALGATRTGAIAARGGEKGDATLNYALELSRRDPAEFARRAPALIEAVDAEMRPTLEARWMEIRAGSADAAQRQTASDWLDGQKTVKREVNARSVAQLLQMAGVARKLGRADAEGWFDYAAALATQTGGGVQGQNLSWGRALGSMGTEAIAHFVDGMKPAAEFGVWATASAELAQNGDAAGANRALARLDELAQTPELQAADKKQTYNTAANQIETARRGVALALASTDAGAALEMALKLSDDWNKLSVLLVVADRAITAKAPDVAEKSLREAMKLREGNPRKFALAASLAQTLNSQLGAEFWPAALGRALPDQSNAGDRYRPSVGYWAFYHAHLDPAQSRVLVEREWNWRLPAAIENKDKEYSNDAQMLGALEMGMAALDPARALEMRQAARAALGDKAGGADVGLAAAIVADDAQRARLGLEGRY